MLLTLFDAFRSGEDIRFIIVEMLLMLPVILFSLSIHESAHGFIAYKCGDPTAHNLGRITLNPIKHFDPIGSLMMLFLGFGWAKPVPVNSRYFKKPKRDMALTAAAGPVSNLIVAFISVLIYIFVEWVFFGGFHGLGLWIAPEELAVSEKIGVVLMDLFYISAFMNCTLALFNLIPVPPFDGSRIAFAFLPDKIYWGIMKYERIILIVVLALSFTASRLGIGLSFGGLAERLIAGVYSHFLWFIGLFA